MKQNEYSILAVDDTDIILELLRVRLEPEGYLVTTASNGEDAKKLINEAQFDLILLDIEMPDISGIELLKYIKQGDTNANTSVFMLTAQNDSEHVRTCLENGAEDYILKPFNAVSIKQRIWKHFQKNIKD